MFIDEHPELAAVYFADAGGERKVLSDQFQAWAEATQQGGIPATRAGLEIALSKIGSGNSEAGLIVKRLLPLA